MKVFLRERSARRRTAKKLAGVTRPPDARHPHERRDFNAEGVRADRVRTSSVGRYLRRSFSPSEYPSGRVAGRLACIYLGLTVLVILSAIPEGNGDGTLSVDLAFMLTWPLSLGVVASQNDGAWMLAAFAVCAFLDALVLWVIFGATPHSTDEAVVARRSALAEHPVRSCLRVQAVNATPRLVLVMVS